MGFKKQGKGKIIKLESLKLIKSSIFGKFANNRKGKSNKKDEEK